MVDRRGQLGLAQEPVTEPLVSRETGSEQLERNPPLEPQTLGQVTTLMPPRPRSDSIR